MPIDNPPQARSGESSSKQSDGMEAGASKRSRRKKATADESAKPVPAASANGDHSLANSTVSESAVPNGVANGHRSRDGHHNRRLDYKSLPKLLRDARKNRIASVQALLETSVDVNERAQGTTALHLAAVHGNAEIGDILIARGADVDTLDGEGLTPIICAVSAGYEDFVQMLLRRGARLRVPGTKRDNCALHAAAKRSKVEILKLLLASKEGPSLVNAQNKDRWTPLHFAADKNNLACAEALLEAGADPNLAEKKGNRPLHFAAQWEHPALTALLVRKGANVNAVNNEQKSALHLATQGGHDEVVYVLCSNGADVSIRYQYGSQLSSKKRRLTPDVEVVQQTTRFGFIGRDVLSPPEDDREPTDGPAAKAEAVEQLPSAAEKAKLDKEFRRADKWADMFRKWREKQAKRIKKGRPPPKEPDKLRSRVYKGLPDRLRFNAWLAMAEVDRLRDEKNSATPGSPLDFQVLCQQPSPHTSQIDLDVNRSARNHVMFVERYGPGQVRLFNILKAYAVYDPEVGYCQGMADLTALMLMYISDDDAFFMLIRLMQDPKYNLADKMKPGLAGLTRTFDVFDLLMQRRLPKLAAHLDAENIMSAAYATKWFMLAFLDIFQFPLTLRLFDLFLLEGYDVVYTVAMSLFTLYEDQLLASKFEALMKFLHSLDKLDLDPDEFVRHIAKHRISSKELQKVEAAVDRQRSERAAGGKR